MTSPEGGQSATDPNASGDSGSTGTGTAGETGQSAGAGTGTEGAAGTTNSGQSAAEMVAKADYEALKARMQAADKRAADNEAALKQIRDKDMPAVEKMTRDLAESQTKLEATTAQLDAMRVENAFLTDNTHKWRNPASAMKLLDRSKIEVDSDGRVTGMKDALAALAKSDAYLLEPATAEGTDGQQGAAGNGAPNVGTPPANGGAGKGASTKDQMARRFPTLRTRLG